LVDSGVSSGVTTNKAYDQVIYTRRVVSLGEDIEFNPTNCPYLSYSEIQRQSRILLFELNMETIISPSLLSADFMHLDREIEMINESDADWIHMDVMDGVFVPNISFGFPVMNAVGKVCKKPMDVHFMIVHPENYIQQTADSGAAIMSVHSEACLHLHRTIQEIHKAGMKAGVTLNPSTPVAMLEDVICDIDIVQLMSVNPGFGGQSFIEESIRKVARLRELIARTGSKALIQVDGGVQAETAPRLVNAGVNVLVSGSYIFKSPDPLKTISELKRLRPSVAL
jgi:hypothetical protein